MIIQLCFWDQLVFPACGGIAIFKIFLSSEATLKITLGTGCRGLVCALLLGTDRSELRLLLCMVWVSRFW